MSAKTVKTIRVYKKRGIPKSLKKACWDKYIGPDKGIATCLCCNHQNIRQIEFHCGHVISEKNGGETKLPNLRPICAQCNLSMSTMNMSEFQKKYFT
jgi:5-methylcytosine-specific restriction endonuclease McrA